MDLLVQLNSISPTVNTAVAALGAVYESLFLRKNKYVSRLCNVSRYHRSLATLQRDISHQLHGPIPLFLASIVLAAADVLQRHYTKALMHLQGAFKILASCLYSTKCSYAELSGKVGSSRDCTDSMAEKVQDLYQVAQALDLQNASYVLSRPPDLPCTFQTEILSPPTRSLLPKDTQMMLLSLLRTCYCFTSQAVSYKYLHYSMVPPDLAIEQGRYVALLLQWLAQFELNFSTGSTTAGTMSMQSRRSLLVLWVQCLSTLVHVSTILSPHEKAYDAHAKSFDQILERSTELIFQSQCSPTIPHQFRLLPGVSQALFLTAMKYRHCVRRRRATDLLRLTGTEGPWDSKILVRVAQRAIDIEEQHLDLDIQNEKEPFLDFIREEDRLHGCGMSSEFDNQVRSKPVEVHFSHCTDEDILVAEYHYDEANHWSIWIEIIEL